MNNHPESAKSIEPADLSELVTTGNVVVVDVRRHATAEQIYGAIRYNPRHLLDAKRLLLPLPKSGTPIVLYDENGDGPDLGPLLAKFEQNGYSGASRLEGGFAAWCAAARRTEELSLEQPVPTVEEQQLER